MGRKIIFILMILSSAVAGLTGCADFEMHVKEEAGKIKPVLILIGPFDVRNMNYDPYVSDEFRDALKFEFFRRGYNSVSIAKSDGSVSGTEWAVKACKDNAGDIVIKGVISQRESGFLADRETDTLVSFTVYSKTGIVLGEGFYHDNESAGNESLRRKAADKFVTALLKKLKRAD